MSIKDLQVGQLSEIIESSWPFETVSRSSGFAWNRSTLKRCKINRRKVPFKKCIGRFRLLKTASVKPRKLGPILAEEMLN
jgi:hypothetical protein